MATTGALYESTAGRPGNFFSHDHYRQRETNVNSYERAASFAAGAIAAVLGLSRRTPSAYFIAGLGGALLYRAATGHCQLYEALDIDTSHAASTTQRRSVKEIATRGFRVQQTFAINRSPEDLYRVWRDFENLPRIMSHVDSVRVLDNRQSHWTVKAPGIVGGKVSWDAEVISDQPGELIAWKSLPNADVDNVGQVAFERLPADRGTLTRVTLSYMPPARRLGKWAADLFGRGPSRQVREDLRAFKRTMETGEAPTTLGQPRGTCTGEGKIYTG